MMTAILRGRRAARYRQAKPWPAEPPAGWPWVQMLPGACRPDLCRGSAKPGRGGRRKRRRRAAADRAYSMLDVLPPGPRAHEATMRFFRLRPSRFPWLLGRRERRRRAKLRRRRARAEARKAVRAWMASLPAFYKRPTHRDVARPAQRAVEYRRALSPIPGA
jgi:hypothetical protein